MGWIIGQDPILDHVMGAAPVAVAWTGCCGSLPGGFGSHMPPHWAQATGEAVKLPDGIAATAIMNLPAILIVLVRTGPPMSGTKESTQVSNVMVAFKLFVVGMVIVVGAFCVHPAFWGRWRSAPFFIPTGGSYSVRC